MLLGMLIMWVVIGFVVMLADNLNVSEDVKDFVVGGFFWLPLVFVVNIIYKKVKNGD